MQHEYLGLQCLFWGLSKHLPYGNAGLKVWSDKLHPDSCKWLGMFPLILTVLYRSSNRSPIVLLKDRFYKGEHANLLPSRRIDG